MNIRQNEPLKLENFKLQGFIVFSRDEKENGIRV